MKTRAKINAPSVMHGRSNGKSPDDNIVDETLRFFVDFVDAIEGPQISNIWDFTRKHRERRSKCTSKVNVVPQRILDKLLSREGNDIQSTKSVFVLDLVVNQWVA